MFFAISLFVIEIINASIQNSNIRINKYGKSRKTQFIIIQIFGRIEKM